MNASPVKYHLALIGANLLYGTNYSYYTSILGKYMNSQDVFLLRISAIALVFVPYMFLTGTARIRWQDLYKFLIVGGLLVFGRQYVMLDGMNYTSPIDGSIIATMSPILIMLISAAVIKEKITWKRTLGILTGAAGALLLILGNAKGGLTSGRSFGNLLLFLSIISSSFNTVYIKELFNRYRPYTVIGWTYLLSLAAVLPLFGKDFLKMHYAAFPPEMWGEIGYIVIGGTMIATALYYYGLKGVSATASSMYAYTQPVIATVFALVRGQDRLTAVTLASAALIFAGVYVVIDSYRQKRKPANPLPKPHSIS